MKLQRMALMFEIRGPCVAAMFCALALPSALALAAPIFPIPPGGHPAGFVPHVFTGVGFLPPGGFLPPIPFADGLVSPDLHHYVIEINNPNPFPMLFGVTFLTPGGVFAADLGLAPGLSALLDLHYMDVPEIGPWLLTAVASPLMPGPITGDAMVIEYPFLAAAPGFGPPIFSGPGGFFGPATGLPGITFGVPAPGTLALLGLAGLATRRRRR